MLDIDTAIRHCLEVAEQNTQGLYDAIALGGQNPTQEEIDNCEQCAAEHRQLAEWLKDYKELREENKVLMQECDRLIKEKGELLSKVSGGDVLRICQLEDQLEEAKRLLLIANGDIYYFSGKNWEYEDAVLKLIGEDETDG